MRRALRLALLAAMIGGVVVGFSPSAAPAGAATCRSAAQHVAIVVDFGDGATVTATCVGLASRATGYDALTARSDALGTAAARIENGLVCGIDGYPATGCAAQNPDGTYSYWSYWKGSGSWTYSSIGASSRANPDVVEGWRFLTKSREASAPPPNGSATASSTCAAAPADTAPGAALPTTPPDDGGGASQAPDATGTPTTAPPAASSSTDAASTEASTTTATTATTAPGASPASSSGEVAAPVVTVSAQDDSAKGGGSPLGLVAGVAVVGGLGVGGAMLVRRRGAIG